MNLQRLSLVGELTKLFLWAFCSTILFQISSYAQELNKPVLSGRVINNENAEPLYGATVRLLGSTVGTITNAEGRYRLLLTPGTHCLSFSYVGFQSETLFVTISFHDTTVDLALKPAPIVLSEVVVSPSANPADGIIRQAIYENQKLHKNLRSYEFDAYTKTVLRVAEDENGKKDTVIAGILETQTKGYWESPDSYIERVTAQRQTSNFTPAQNIFTVGRVLNLNDDNIVIDNYTLPGPISPSALDYYDYALVNTSSLDGTTVYHLSITPKKKSSPLFIGYIDVSAKNFALVGADVRLNNAVSLSPINNLHIKEQFSSYEDSFYLPTHIEMFYVIKFTFLPMPPIFVDYVSVLYDYFINPTFPRGFFDAKLVSVENASAFSDSTRWHRQQLLPLTSEEHLAYSRIDSIMGHLNCLDKTMLFLSRLPLETRSLPVSSFSDFFHYNRVEGAYLGVGLVRDSLIQAIKLAGNFGYGFSDRRWEYGLLFETRLPAAREFSIGGALFDRLSYREGEDVYSTFDVTMLSLLSKQDYRDYFLSRGWKGYLRWEPRESFSATATYINDKQNSVSKNTNFALFNHNDLFSNNPPISNGLLRSVVLSFSIDTRKYFNTGLFIISDVRENSWLLEGSFELSNQNVLRSNFSFSRLYVSLFRHQTTFSSGYIDVWLTGGLSGGNVPVQRLFEVQSSYDNFAKSDVFRTLYPHEIITDQFLSVCIEHDFGNAPLVWSHIPFVEHLGVDLTTITNSVFAKGYPPTVELGIGIGNILPFIRFNFTWTVIGSTKRFVFTSETPLEF